MSSPVKGDSTILAAKILLFLAVPNSMIAGSVAQQRPRRIGYLILASGPSAYDPRTLAADAEEPRHAATAQAGCTDDSPYLVCRRRLPTVIGWAQAFGADTIDRHAAHSWRFILAITACDRPKAGVVLS